MAAFMLINSASTSLAEDPGYFLSMQQKGQLK